MAETATPKQVILTVAIHSVYIVLELAATKTRQIIIEIDVKGAFMQTPMSGEPACVELDQKITRHAVDLYPKLEKMVESNRCLCTVILKALYGCVQASAL
jgi:hypothetical protein